MVVIGRVLINKKDQPRIIHSLLSQITMLQTIQTWILAEHPKEAILSSAKAASQGNLHHHHRHRGEDSSRTTGRYRKSEPAPPKVTQFFDAYYERHPLSRQESLNELEERKAKATAVARRHSAATSRAPAQV